MSGSAQMPFESVRLGQLVDNLIQATKCDGRLSDEHVLGLSALLPHTCEGALEILDKGLMTIIEAKPSGRNFFLFAGKKNASYVCFGHYCSCPSFIFSVMIKSELYCKHQLAAHLVHATNNCKRREIRDEEYAGYFASL